MQLMDTFDVAVVGAGHNGLACAALLGKSGLRVAVFERRDRIGGAAVTESDVWPGYKISAASYVVSLLDPWLIETLELRKHGYDAYRKLPWEFTPLSDGRSILLGVDRANDDAEISRFNAADVPGFHAFDERVESLGRKLFETFSEEEPRFERFDRETRRILEGSAAELVEQYVSTPVLQAALVNDGLVGTHLGPRNRGTGYVLAHHNAGRAFGAQGAWGYVRGGMGAITQALASSARSHGVQIFSNARVERILTYNDRVSGVLLDDGRDIAVRVVASNAHPKTTFLELLDGAALDHECLAKLHAWKTVGPSLKLNLAIGELPNFIARPGTNPQPHHKATIHVAPSIDYLQKAYQDALVDGESREPMIEGFLQTPTDPSLAPPGKHILSIFAQYFPYDRHDGWSESVKNRAADKIVDTLSRFAPNLPNVIEARQILSPADLESRIGLVGGHIFHGELIPGQIYEHRFATRTPLSGLYLCGSGAHPGGCVSGFPGKRAAAAIVADMAVTV